MVSLLPVDLSVENDYIQKAIFFMWFAFVVQQCRECPKIKALGQVRGDLNIVISQSY